MIKNTTGGMPASRDTEPYWSIVLRATGHGKPIDKAKELVPVLDLVRTLCPDLRKVGHEYEARCPVPHHEDRTASFRVNPDKGYFYCHGCGVGGDVVELYKRVHGHDRAEVAAAELLMEFGFEPPQRPPSWYARQARQRPVLDRATRRRIEHVSLLVFRLMWVPWLRRLPECVRDKAEQSARKDSLWMAERIYANRRSA